MSNYKTNYIICEGALQRVREIDLDYEQVFCEYMRVAEHRKNIIISVSDDRNSIVVSYNVFDQKYVAIFVRGGEDE